MSTGIAVARAAAFADLRGRVALVTGGNAGIGLGMATGLARAGAAVAIWGTNEVRNAAAVDALAAEQPDGEVAAFAVDVADETAVDAGIAAVVERFGRLDCCFANAGITGPPAPIEELSVDIWRRVLAVNLDGLMFTLRAASRQLRRQGDGGALVVTSSIGSLHGMARHAAYAATKGGVAAVVRALAVELARDDITVNAILPGWVDTAMTEEMLASSSAVNRILPRIPLRRWGTPDDFAATAVLLAGPGARYLTGQAIVIDGGYTIF